MFIDALRVEIIIYWKLTGIHYGFDLVSDVLGAGLHRPVYHALANNPHMLLENSTSIDEER